MGIGYRSERKANGWVVGVGGRGLGKCSSGEFGVG